MPHGNHRELRRVVISRRPPISPADGDAKAAGAVLKDPAAMSNSTSAWVMVGTGLPRNVPVIRMSGERHGNAEFGGLAECLGIVGQQDMGELVTGLLDMARASGGGSRPANAGNDQLRPVAGNRNGLIAQEHKPGILYHL